MQAVLTRLTLILTGVVVVVVAAYLILIADALLKANRNLEKLVGGLEAIRDNTVPLEGDLGTINGAASTLRDKLMSVDQHLQNIVRLARG
jgi:hypothetical protein